MARRNTIRPRDPTWPGWSGLRSPPSTSGTTAPSDVLVERLVDRPRTSVADHIDRMLEVQVSLLWRNGWQPADLARVVSNKLTSREVLLVRSAIAADAGSYEEFGARVAPDWMNQLHGIEATRWWNSERSWPLQLDDDWRFVVLAAIRLLNLLGHLPDLPLLAPPPHEWDERTMSSAGGAQLPSEILGKVRSLLAKAESTTFDAEAEALTAKAQELMTRHRIDQATLASAGEAGEEPVGRRIGIDDPYAEAKATLLGAIAGNNGCKAVWTKALGFTTVFGFPGELEATEELFTSLLVQATAALRREGSKQDRFGRSRTTRFRRSFLVAFAVRIDRRLRETVDRTTNEVEAETGAALVPMLEARSEATEAAAAAAFPELSQFSPAATDDEGWFAGTLFGDTADLSLGPPLERRSA